MDGEGGRFDHRTSIVDCAAHDGVGRDRGHGLESELDACLPHQQVGQDDRRHAAIDS
jgi:hypothetical protein